jgi:DNA-directed RNA polymerase subunit E'/Rpb7
MFFCCCVSIWWEGLADGMERQAHSADCVFVILLYSLCVMATSFFPSPCNHASRPRPLPPPNPILTPLTVTFQLLVFRPPKSTILLARIASQTSLGIHLSTEFFDDIFVPSTLLFPNSVYEAGEGVWVWHNNAEVENEEDKLYFDNGNTVRVRVEAEFWTDQAPDGKKKGEVGEGERSVPWRIEGSMAEPGLGDVMWW